jgi:hypothetical protein
MRQHLLTHARLLLVSLLLNLSLSFHAVADLSCIITGVSEVTSEGSLDVLAGQKIITRLLQAPNSSYNATRA